MSKHSGVFSCGCEGQVELFGRASDRARQAEYIFSQVCYECQRREANEKSKQQAEEFGFPELIGTEKQVIWANTIRSSFYNAILKEINNAIEGHWFNKLRELTDKKDLNDTQIVDYVTKLLNHMIATKLQASYYIDNRYVFSIDMLRKLEKDFTEYEKEKVLGATDDLIIESTVAPKECKYKGIVEIKATDKVIKAFYEKNEKFIEIVKSLNYKWNGVWERTLGWNMGSYIDRAAELGNVLLNEGFSVCIFNEEIRRKAIEGDYVTECRKWILFKNSKLNIWIIDKNDFLYKKARKLSGSSWDSPNVTVPIQNYEEVLDFAELYGFKITETVEKAIKEYKEKTESITRVEPVKVVNVEPVDKLKELLESGDDVLDDLKD